MLKNLEELINIIRERKRNQRKSYTNKLFNDKKLNIEKVKEEIGELIEVSKKMKQSTRSC